MILGSKVLETLPVEEIRDVILGSSPTYQEAKDACIHDVKPIVKNPNLAILNNLTILLSKTTGRRVSLKTCLLEPGNGPFPSLILRK